MNAGLSLAHLVLTVILLRTRRHGKVKWLSQGHIISEAELQCRSVPLQSLPFCRAHQQGPESRQLKAHCEGHKSEQLDELRLFVLSAVFIVG